MIENNRIVSNINIYNAFRNGFLFKQLEYIESTGEQYIDTHWYPTEKTRIELDMQSDTNMTETKIIGSRESKNSSDLFLLLITGEKYRFDYGADKLSINNAPRSGNIHIDINRNKISINSVSATNTLQEFRSKYPIYIFTINTGGSSDSKLSAKIFSCKIYNSDILVRDFIPVQSFTEEIGLYDLVNNQFYKNLGTGSFIPGPFVKFLYDTSLNPPIVKKPANVYYIGKLLGIDMNDFETKKRLLSSSNSKQCIDHASNLGLPKEYYPVEYLKSTGTQYIDTGYNPGGATTRVITRIEIDEEYDKDPFALFGARQTGIGSNVFAVWAEASDKNLRWDYNKSSYSLPSIPYLNDWLIDFNMNNFKANELTYSSTKTNYTITKSMYIFALNQGTFNNNQIARMKLYYMKIYNNGIKVRDYIPCIRISDNTPGLYDMVNNIFYTNIGTGKFLTGPRIRNFNMYLNKKPYTRLSYIYFDGNQYINTGYVANQDTRVILVADVTPKSGIYAVFGGRHAANGLTYSLWYYKDHFRYDYRIGSAGQYTTGFSGVHTVETNKNKVILDGKTIITVSATSDFNTTNPLALASTYSGSTNGDENGYDTRRMIANVYSFKIYDNEQLVRDYIPVKMNDGQVGLYDLVENKFYENSGTGSITAGPEL